jgi:hypothetical protein
LQLELNKKGSLTRARAQHESEWIGTELNMKAIWIELEFIMKMTTSSGNMNVESDRS